MIDLSTLAAHLHEHNTLKGGFSLDIQWWTAFTTPWSGCSFFLLPNWTLALDLELYTDSSGTIGYDTYCKIEWFNGRWTPEQAIQYKELDPIVLATAVWGHN